MKQVYIIWFSIQIVLGNVAWPDYEQFKEIDFDDEFDSNFLPIPKVKGQTDLRFVEPRNTNMGLHICTKRLCNCYIGSCYAYCVWGWCYEHDNEHANRYYFPCDTELKPKDCKRFSFLCTKIC